MPSGHPGPWAKTTVCWFRWRVAAGLAELDALDAAAVAAAAMPELAALESGIITGRDGPFGIEAPDEMLGDGVGEATGEMAPPASWTD